MSVPIHRETDVLANRVEQCIAGASSFLPFAKIGYEVQIGPMPFEGDDGIIVATGVWLCLFHPHPLQGNPPVESHVKTPFGRALSDDVLAGLVASRVKNLFALLEEERTKAGLG